MTFKQPNSTTSPTIVEGGADGAKIEYTDIPLSNGTAWGSPPKIYRGGMLLDLSLEEAGTVTRLWLDLLIDHWDKVVFGPCVEGAVFELKQKNQPKRVSMLDGYLTICFWGNK